jgi:hypothetical protein
VSDLTKRALEIAHSAHVVAPTVLELVFGAAGHEYGVGPLQKADLVARLIANTQTSESSTMFGEHVALVREILMVPRRLPGDVAEFGCFKGMSTASLSLACALTGRRLVVFDSFRGLPAQDEKISNFDGREVRYETGSFAGSLDEVKRNVAKRGNISVCEFVVGFFSETLPRRPPKERFVLIFEDADLPSSVRDVLKFAWPKLQDKCKFLSQEARDREVMEIFFDRAWWMDTLHEAPPGITGSGIGLPLSRSGSGLAYAVRSEQGGSSAAGGAA